MNELQNLIGMQQQARSGLPITKQLHDLFPDIEGQLCSRHSTLFCKLKTNFTRLYDNMEPQYYVVVKGDCQIVDESITEMRMSMGLENGIIILVSKTYSESQIFINSNHFTEQLIFTHTGQLQEGLNNLSTDITSLIKNSIQDLKEKELFGGIFYIHANMPEGRFCYNQSLLMGIYLGMLIINGRINKVSKQDVIQNMVQLGSMGTQESIKRRFDHYFNRTFDISNPENALKNSNPLDIHHYPRLNNDYKLMMCKLDLATQDIRYEITRRHDIRDRKNQLMSEITKEFPQIISLAQLSTANINLQKQITFKSTYFRSQEAKTIQELECQDEQEILRQPSKFLNTLQSEIKLIENFQNKTISIDKLIDTLWKIQSKELHLYTDDVVELVQKMKIQLQLNACMIVDHCFLMILVHKNRHTELLCEVKQKLNKGELKSKSLFKIQQEEIVQQRFRGDKSIGQRLFTSVPSKGVAIFDPSEAIWFQ